MLDRELPMEGEDAPTPRATAISGVPEDAVPALLASAARDGAGIAVALDELRRSALELAATPPLGVAASGSPPREHTEHASVHVALEGISLIAAHVVEDARLAATVVPGEATLGRAMVVPAGLSGPLRAQVSEAGRALLAAHRALVERATERLAARDRAPVSVAAAAARSLSLGLLPAGTRTSMYLSASAGALASLCAGLVGHPLPEVALAGRALFDASRAAAPELFPAALTGRAGAAAPTEIARAIMRLYAPPPEGASATMVISQPVRLVRHDKDALERVILALAYDGSDPAVHASALSGSLRSVREPALLDVVKALLADRGPGELVPRGFEASTMTFEIMIDAATALDLLRRRSFTASTQRLTCRLGFHVPDDLIDLGLTDMYQDAMLAAQASWGEIEAEDPLAAEYVVPLGYRARSLWTIDLRRLIQLLEVRSSRDNPTRVRRVAHGLYRTAAAVLPWLRDLVKIDLD